VLAGLREHFDWIIIDTPPVLAVTDASIVAHGCSGVVLVVGAEMVSRHSARVAVDQLDAVQARVLGAVLNRVDLEHQAYYYARYYRREYARYYQAS
jgi:Mrp family chromosome partitioning ATPase